MRLQGAIVQRRRCAQILPVVQGPSVKESSWVVHILDEVIAWHDFPVKKALVENELIAFVDVLVQAVVGMKYA